MKNRGKIKVLNIITALGIGGAEKLLLSTVRRLNSDRFISIVLSLYQDKEYEGEFLETANRVIKINYTSKLNPLIIKNIASVIRHEKPAIVHTHLPHATIWGRIAAKMSGVELILTTEHNTSVWKRKKGIFYILYKLTYRINNLIIAISDAVRNKMIESFGIPKEYIKVIHNGIEFDEQRKYNLSRYKLSQIQHPIIGTIGRLHKAKGHEYLVRAFATVKRKFPNANLIIVGDGNQRVHLRRLSEKLSLSNSVFFLGKRKDIYRILQAIDVFVFPSLEEGLGIALIEACAQGKSCIASNTGGIPEVIVDGKNGFLVAPGDESAIARKVLEILRDDKKRHEIETNAKLMCREKFNIAKKVKELENIYLKLYKEKK